MSVDASVPRRPWKLPFLAEPAEVAALRRIVRLHLRTWGLTDQAYVAETCVSELVANVINHVGFGTPTTLAMSMRDTFLRSRSTTRIRGRCRHFSRQRRMLSPGGVCP